jgi:hypothetical protein
MSAPPHDLHQCVVVILMMSCPGHSRNSDMSRRDVVLCHPVRIAIGTYGGSLKSMPAAPLGAAAVKALLDRAKLGSREGRRRRHG